KFSKSETTNWKLLYRAKNPEDKNTKQLQDKLKKFLADRNGSKMYSSFDIYTMDENFVVLHGLQSEENAKNIASILKEFKDYKIQDAPIVISGQNYEIVQMKKNIAEYLANPELVDISVVNQLPFTPPPAEVTPPPAQPKAPVNQAAQPNVQSKNQPPANNQLPGKANNNPANTPNPAFQSQPPRPGQQGNPPNPNMQSIQPPKR
ncbi:MAG TPA: hypothetical protein VGB43_04185, partial [Flavobacterium sp.]